jgi:hypothetical protein
MGTSLLGQMLPSYLLPAGRGGQRWYSTETRGRCGTMTHGYKRS